MASTKAKLSMPVKKAGKASAKRKPSTTRRSREVTSWDGLEDLKKQLLAAVTRYREADALLGKKYPDGVVIGGTILAKRGEPSLPEFQNSGDALNEVVRIQTLLASKHNMNWWFIRKECMQVLTDDQTEIHRGDRFIEAARSKTRISSPISILGEFGLSLAEGLPEEEEEE